MRVAEAYLLGRRARASRMRLLWDRLASPRRRMVMATTTESQIRWRTSLDEALQEAGRSGKPVLLDFFSAT